MANRNMLQSEYEENIRVTGMDSGGKVAAALLVVAKRLEPQVIIQEPLFGQDIADALKYFYKKAHEGATVGTTIGDLNSKEWMRHKETARRIR